MKSLIVRPFFFFMGPKHSLMPPQIKKNVVYPTQMNVSFTEYKLLKENWSCTCQTKVKRNKYI